MIEKFSSVLHAERKAFSVVGRRARMSYAWERAGRRWLEEGSEMERVQRWRMVTPGGTRKGIVRGIGSTIVEGIFSLMW